MHKLSSLVVLLLLTPTAFAELAIPSISTQPLHTTLSQDTTLAKTGLTQNEEDITADQDIHKLTLSTEQLHEAQVWGLTTDEEKRYVFLMNNRSGLYYRGLRQTPIDILGINARNEAERNHFAELGAQQEAQKVAKNIAWNNAFYKAYNQLFAGIPVVGDFDPSPYSPYAHKSLQLTGGETLYFFIRPDTAVKTVLLLLIEAIESAPNTHLHILFVGSDDLAIQLWANQHQIPQSLVSSGRITLNHGDLNYQALTLAKKSIPLLLLAKNGASSVVDLGRF